ncbi:GTP-binding protein Era [Mycoplasmopsis californica HAZ160_1]|uniref:GTPase Era n=2 Tax=Mycoplasmopsis californica TaxID=2113 RepID=A0A059XWX4_9BACT|nr:GTPase Era [Mycoplasmopsis californica]AIA29722.1 GTP-binding protein Era [Mycoplasmopsis californica]BAP00817.1 GTP-binding protein Era [Mycoplasmopsis californica HAZ160_1]BBG40672.1 GTP-binding protein Era [Mycoplasmopsis californica]BBG41267.1 GTP-binding protein Era [Mycoplasmopsis californica]BBG41860.1 GTP-binding protein Era [Mycoplasmopsis californica]
MKVAIVTIIGRPNVGKSSLLNSILNYELAIVSNIPQTTRDQISGVYNEEGYQIVFVDTPGVHKPLNKLGESLNKNAFDALSGIDCVLFLTPVNEPIGQGDKNILEKIKSRDNKIAVISKIDLAKSPSEIQDKITQLNEYGFNKILSVSTSNPNSIRMLIDELKTFTEDGNPYYDEDYITDKSMRFMTKEIIRVSAMKLLREELPHSIAVEVSEFIEDYNLISIEAVIYVKKDSQKGMVIGKNAQMIKQIGTNARKQIMNLFGIKVDLRLKVKTANKWINDAKFLKKFGY